MRKSRNQLSDKNRHTKIHVLLQKTQLLTNFILYFFLRLTKVIYTWLVDKTKSEYLCLSTTIQEYIEFVTKERTIKNYDVRGRL